MTGYSTEVVAAARTFLFVPANRPDRFDKAAAAGADIVILDLEDAVTPADKDAAREYARAWLTGGNAALVRINAVGTTWFVDDVALIAECGAPVMLPKAEDPGVIAEITRSAPGTSVVPLVETAAGILVAPALCAAPGVARLAFGSIDLAAQLGVDPDDREALLFARSTLVFASATAGLAPPIDGVTTAISEVQQVADDTAYARGLGLQAKLCIHPAQLGPARDALAPSADDVAWARRIVAAAAEGGSAVAVDGMMVDIPVVERAQRILAAVGQ